ncbi:MAG TPA: CPBP family intramembrane glutamic endopeptidase [Thermoanaerobaculia bacterium]|nr:CPBP family intramembrane glutamic endopeptidase [Thermoanaerobaculia bacterium]
MRAILQRFPFTAFVLIAFAWTWPLAAGVRWSLMLPLLGLFGPLIGAVAVVWALEGGAGLRRLWRRFALRRHHLGWLAAAFALPLLLLVPIWLLERITASAPALALGPISFVSVVLAFLIVGEEVGWRGFALPHLLGRWPALWSSLGVGVVWALWHLPNFLLPGFPHQGLPFAAFVLIVVAYSVLFTWLHLRTEGSLLVAVVFHASLNLFSVAGMEPARQYWWRALVYSFVALVVVASGSLATSPCYPSTARSSHDH